MSSGMRFTSQTSQHHHNASATTKPNNPWSHTMNRRLVWVHGIWAGLV